MTAACYSYIADHEVTSMIDKNSAQRKHSILISRITILLSVLGSLGTYFWQPVIALHFAADILLRTYLHFVAGAMAHEGVHGHLGNSRSGNLWWTRIALIPTTVPAVTFRKTHLQHHAATNIPDQDPDEFLNTKRFWEIPLRAIAMPHHWLLWLWKRGSFTRQNKIEYLLTYMGYAAVYGLIAAFTGIDRVLLGLLPAAILHSLLLWYLFAIKTHEGYFTGMAAERSHDYLGRPLYWFSFGLSMHRLHHMKPQLAWLQMARHISPATWRQCLRLERDIQRPAKTAA
jgi:fatty acid desaturase